MREREREKKGMKLYEDGGRSGVPNYASFCRKPEGELRNDGPTLEDLLSLKRV